VEITGEVEDLRPYIKESVVSVAPLTYGSGVKTKILETMAMGVPAITNNIGAEGIVEDIQADNNTGLYVCGSIKEFAENIILLMTDEKLNSKASNAAAEYIKRNFTWEMTLRNFDSIFNREKRFNGNENIICFKKPHKRKLRRWNKRQETLSGA
jgi:glycosyltransferase involved in cell wall biosynthesis